MPIPRGRGEAGLLFLTLPVQAGAGLTSFVRCIRFSIESLRLSLPTSMWSFAS